ncbi:MAG: citrulline utilization hydrolase CtlX [Bacteroidia bacterium]
MKKKLLLIRPKHFGFNAETALTNGFMEQTTEAVEQLALAEFDAFTAQLNKHAISFHVFEDREKEVCPDAVFLNNWFSTHNRTLVLYPMQAPSRRRERRMDIELYLRQEFDYERVIDLSHWEKQDKFLEGTGSMVIDHKSRFVYAALSPRTDCDVLLDFCEKLGYLPVTFSTRDRLGASVYHTNVIMALGECVAVVCFEAIADERDQHSVFRMLELSGREIVPISLEQMENFCGNMLFVSNDAGEACLVASERAWGALEETQRTCLMRHAKPVLADLSVLERVGGGGARCMLAEVFC